MALLIYSDIHIQILVKERSRPKVQFFATINYMPVINSYIDQKYEDGVKMK